LVSRCGKAIDETLLKNKAQVTFEDWLNYAVFRLEDEISMWPTLVSLINTLRETSPAMSAIRTLLYRRFLPNEGPVKVNDPIDQPKANFLAAEGALRYEGDASYSVPSPLLRSLLSREVVMKLEGLPLPRIPPPFIMNGLALDVVPLLKTALAVFNADLLRSAVRESFKISLLPGMTHLQVPQEAVYQSELERILRSWLPSSVPVIPQSNAGGRKRTDLIIAPSEKHRIVLELVASSPLESVTEHFQRAKEYGQQLNAKYVWVVHFTLKEEDTKFKYPYPESTTGVNVLHVWHNFEFTMVAITYSDGTGTIKNEDIALTPSS